MTGQNPREIAVQVLRRREQGKDYVENLLESALAESGLSTADRGLAQELTYGVARWQATLDWLIARKTQGRTQKVGLKILLRLGLYQMFWLDRIPDHAAVNETVEMAKRLGFGAQASFVNAVLRGYVREKEKTRLALAELKANQPALGLSHPEWLWDRWQKHWGTEQARQLLEWNNTPPPTYARVNTLRADASKLIEQWRQEGVEYEFCRWDWTGENLVFALKSHPPLARLPSFQQGWFYVQDPSTLLAVRELNPQPGDTVLDFCAAPGGKTTFIAQLMENRGRIVACDNSPERLRLLQENCARLGVTCVEALLNGDNLKFEIRDLRFDKILLDAPCSNTGVMRRRVDLRWRLRPEEIERLRATQLQLLRQAAPGLKPGGTLVYSTCSLEPEENSGLIRDYLKESRDYRLELERELLPFREGVDGAYMGRLRLL